jgi:hypothetical protein
MDAGIGSKIGTGLLLVLAISVKRLLLISARSPWGADDTLSKNK